MGVAYPMNKFPTRCLYLLRQQGSVRKPAQKSDYHR